MKNGLLSSNYLIITGLELLSKRKILGLSQEELAKEVGLERKTIMNYEKLEAIPSKKSTLLDNFFNSRIGSDKVDVDGQEISIEKLAYIVATNEERLMKETVFANIINVRVAKKVAELIANPSKLKEYLKS